MKLKLSEREREIISCAYFRADMSVKELASETGYREHLVRASLRALRDRKVISDRVFINPFAMGLREYQLFFKLVTPGETARKALADALKESKITTWVSAIGGPYQLSCLILVRSSAEIDLFFESLLAKAKGVSFERLVTPLVSVTLFPPKYLTGSRYSVSALSYGEVESPGALDQRDFAIVTGLIRVNSSSMAKAARELGMPLTTFDYRVKALRSSGVILGFGYYLSKFYSDGMTPSFVRICLKRFSGTVKNQILNYCQAHPNITYLIRTIGDADYEVGLKVSEPIELSSIVEELKLRFSNEISRVDVHPIFELIKLSPDPLSAIVPVKKGEAVVGF